MTEIFVGILAGVGASGVVGMAADDMSRKQYNKLADIHILKEKNNIQDYASETEIDTLARSRELEERIEELDIAEKESFTEMVKDWETSHGYSESMASLVSQKRDAINKLRSDLNVEENLNEALDKMNADIRAFDEANGISDKIDECESIIADAKDKYDHEKTMVNLFGNGDSSEAMKKAAKKIRNTTISEQEAKINTLKNSLEAEKRRLRTEYEAKKSEINSAYNSAKNRLADQYDKEIANLQASRANAVNDIRRGIVDDRPPEEVEMRKECDRLLGKSKDISDRIADKVREEAAKLDKTELIAGYLKDHGWSKPKVIAVASLPLIPFGYAGYKYVKGVIAVVSKM